jgi:hypothetical protein
MTYEPLPSYELTGILYYAAKNGAADLEIVKEKTIATREREDADNPTGRLAIVQNKAAQVYYVVFNADLDYQDWVERFDDLAEAEETFDNYAAEERQTSNA